jgi:hypothetical protein
MHDRSLLGSSPVVLRTFGYSGLLIRYTLILDPQTGRILGEEETLQPGKLNAPPRSVIAYTTFLASGYVASPGVRP